MPHVNPTIETWGTDDDGRKPYTLSQATLHQSGYSGVYVTPPSLFVSTGHLLHSRLTWTHREASAQLSLTFSFSLSSPRSRAPSRRYSLVLAPSTPVSLLWICCGCRDNAMGSPDYFVDYADPGGPNESHKWLQSHPFY
eukprot:2028729-Rhodomonas_salina.1